MRKRSNYRPRGVRLDTMAWVKSGLQCMGTHPAAIDLKIKNHSAMAAVAQGTATRADIDVMIAAVNVTEALATQGLGSDWADEIRQAQDALLHMTRRGVQRGDRFVCTGPELTALNLIIEIHDAQLERCTVAALERALEHVKTVIRQRRARQIEAAA